jgi:hypothetical protein
MYQVNALSADLAGDIVKQTEAAAKFYEPGILQPEVHWRLVADLPGIARTANIPPQYVYKHSMKGTCSQAEVNWVRTFKTLVDKDIAGLALHGQHHTYERMLTIAGALIRNFIDARVMTLQSVIDQLKGGLAIEGTVVLIPNFHVSPEKGGQLHPRFVGLLLDWMYQRYGEQKQTIIGIEGIEQIREDYGDDVCQLIAEHYMNAL